MNSQSIGAELCIHRQKDDESCIAKPQKLLLLRLGAQAQKYIRLSCWYNCTLPVLNHRSLHCTQVPIMEFQTTWIHSTTVDEIEVRRFGAFTTLPVRISKYNDIANNATQKLSCSWDASVGMRSSNLVTLAGDSGVNLVAYALAEALPDRMATAVRLAQLGQLCEGMHLCPQSIVCS